MLFLLRCDIPASDRLRDPVLPGEAVECLDLSAVPTRKELRFLDDLERFVVGSTPSLDELMQRPDAPHLGTPQPDPHQVSERVRVVVHGSDAAVAAVVSKLMRIDALWVEVGFIPSGASSVALSWGLDATFSPAQHLTFALASPAVPTPVIRDDHGVVTLGVAEVTGPVDSTGKAVKEAEMIGEVIVDSEVLYEQNKAGTSDFNNGVRLVPTPDAPGLAAVQRPPLPRKGWFGRTKKPRSTVSPTVLRGRALQAGGVDLAVTRDGVRHPRPLKSVTFYRHLRDGQFVRN
ncbi:hypothetical protein L8U58_05385 [Corynebacterium sp. c9Ua_112]|uniref:Uncharacterized protein n=1 Tax=Corynebacterium macclintockiae TaxID=2913501 RepID=A0A9X3RRD8_9CORY|nr:hypothetical protein [Corynebacterium macclintockiae]MCZ9304971.1 hypothetical protein [Corynebacterium macclintockiae]